MTDLTEALPESVRAAMKRWTIEVTTEDGPRTLIIYALSEAEARVRVPTEIARSTGQALSDTTVITGIVSIVCSGFVRENGAVETDEKATLVKDQWDPPR